METLKEVDTQIVVWLNQWVGRYGPFDSFVELVISDYFIPVLMGLILLGLWFTGKGSQVRSTNQRAVITAVVALGLANLAVLLITDYYFRPRPFADNDLTLLFYQPTDSSFPANPTALSIALSFGVWRSRRAVGTALLLLAALWSVSRMYAGVFYLSDIVAAALIGAAISYLVALGLRRMEPVPTLVLRLAQMLHLA